MVDFRSPSLKFFQNELAASKSDRRKIKINGVSSEYVVFTRFTYCRIF
jgi:hypothetical protein